MYCVDLLPSLNHSLRRVLKWGIPLISDRCPYRTQANSRVLRNRGALQPKFAKRRRYFTQNLGTPVPTSSEHLRAQDIYPLTLICSRRKAIYENSWRIFATACRLKIFSARLYPVAYRSEGFTLKLVIKKKPLQNYPKLSLMEYSWPLFVVLTN